MCRAGLGGGGAGCWGLASVCPQGPCSQTLAHPALATKYFWKALLLRVQAGAGRSVRMARHLPLRGIQSNFRSESRNRKLVSSLTRAFVNIILLFFHWIF